MHLIWKRYARSGSAPPWFYALFGSGFVALTVWAIMQRDWLVASIAVAMVPVTVAGGRMVKRFALAARTTPLAPDTKEDRRDRPTDD